MKKVIVLAFIFCAAAFSTRAQDIIVNQRNQATLVKGSRALPSVKFKDGQMVTMQNTDNGMEFTFTKNAKQFPLFDPVDAKFGQVVEADVDGDGKMEIVAGYRKSDHDFTVNIYKKPEYEFDYKLWATVTGTDHMELLGNGTVKLYTKEGSVNVMKFDSEGKLTPVSK